MFKYLFWAIAIYFLVRFIVNFVIPVYRATRQMKNQVKDFQSRMHQQNQAEQDLEQKKANPKVKEGDYIDFEEIK
jgi:hypothetical protein